jgi:hypothetical protein
MIRKSQMLSPDQLSAIQEGYHNESFDASIISSTTGPLPRLGSKNSSMRSLKSSTLGADGKLPAVVGGGGSDIASALKSIHTQFNDVREEMIAIELSRSKSTEDREKGIHTNNNHSTCGKSVTFPETLTRINSNNTTTTTGPLVIVTPRTNNNSNVSPRLEPLDNRPVLFPLEKNILDQTKPLPLPLPSSSSSQRQQQQPSPEQKSSTPLSSSSKIKQEKYPADEYEEDNDGHYDNEEFADHHQSPQKKIVVKDQMEPEDSLYEEEEHYDDDHHEPQPPTQIQIQTTTHEQEQEYENVYAEEDNNTKAVQKSPFTPKSAKEPAVRQIIQSTEEKNINDNADDVDDAYEYDHYDSTKDRGKKTSQDTKTKEKKNLQTEPTNFVVSEDPQQQKDDDYQQDDDEFLEEPAAKSISIQNSNQNLLSTENNEDNHDSNNNDDNNDDRSPYLSSDWRNDSFDEFDPITHARKPRNNVQEIEMTMHSADFEMLVMSLGQMTHIMH